jgi:hypothetical protein
VRIEVNDDVVAQGDVIRLDCSAARASSSPYRTPSHPLLQIDVDRQTKSGLGRLSE